MINTTTTQKAADAINANGLHTINRVAVSIMTARPTLSTLGDVLKETVNHERDGFTKITGSTASRWHDVDEGADTLYLEIDAVSACLKRKDDVTVFIRQGVTVHHARNLLKAIAKQIKAYDNLEQVTPLETASDEDSMPF